VCCRLLPHMYVQVGLNNYFSPSVHPVYHEKKSTRRFTNVKSTVCT